MPQKQIYISNDDIPIYEELQQYAQQTGESVSSVVIEAITDFLAARREMKGKEEYIIQTIECGTFVPEPVSVKRLKFYGRLLAASLSDRTNGIFEQWRIYHTKQGKLVFWHKFGYVEGEQLDLQGAENGSVDQSPQEEFIKAEYFIRDQIPVRNEEGIVTICERVVPAQLVQDAIDNLQVEWLEV